MSFSDLGLSPEVLRAVADSGYTEPTPIQQQAIPHVLMGRDILGCAQTGTGKTAGFTLPMIDILSSGRARARMPRSLIIEPTRELAAQVSENFEKYGKHTRLSMALLIGGESFVDQERKLDRGVDVLIATPGRLLDLFERGKIILSDVKILVIDEADRMLDMGFIPDVERIVSLLPPLRQTLFFSATMPPEIRRLADAFLSNPREVTVSPSASTSANTADHVCVVAEADKRDTLRALLEQEDVRNAIVFCNRKRDVDVVAKSLIRHGCNARPLHGDMAQSKRTETLDAFRKGEVTILVASDVAARGLDIVDLSHVFNFDVPMHAEDYVHRIGRTGRAGKLGRAFTLAGPEDGRYLGAIEVLIGREIPKIGVPGIETAELDASEDGRRRRGGRSRAPAAKPAARAKPEGAAKPARGRKPRRREGEDPEIALGGAAADAAPDTAPAESAFAEATPLQPASIVEAASERETAEPRAKRPPRTRRRAAASRPAEPVPGGTEQVPSGGEASKQAQSETARSEEAEVPHTQPRASERPSRAARAAAPRAPSGERSRPERVRPERVRPERVRPERDRDERGARGGDGVIGFGDRVPAFMLVPARKEE